MSTVAPGTTPATDHPNVQQAAMGRYVQDQAALASRPAMRPPAPGLDERLLHYVLGKIWAAYRKARSFAVYHLCGFVSSKVRLERLEHCRGCSFRSDPGDGIIYCKQRQRQCGCPQSPFSGIWWLTHLRRFGCPLGHFVAHGLRSMDHKPS